MRNNTNNLKSFYTILSLLIASSLFFQCTNQKKVKYDIPDHVTAANRELLIAKAEKGKVLYGLHCSACHGIFTKGKDSIPNFTKVQIDNYHAAALIGIDARNHAVAKKMSSEQVDQVMTFLRLRKIDNPIKDTASKFRDSIR
jgi:mono/diheme cytochrome c family protein